MSLPTNPQFQSPLNRSSLDKFLMILDLPYALKKKAEKDSSISIDPLQISIHGTIVPNIAVPEIDTKFRGQNLYLTSYTRPSYPPITVNFLVDGQYNNYFVLWQWLNVMNNVEDSVYGGTARPTQEDNIITGSQAEYQTTITVLGLDEYNNPVIEFVYTKAFITNLGSINYSYREGSSLIECTASFHFSQLYVNKK